MENKENEHSRNVARFCGEMAFIFMKWKGLPTDNAVASFFTTERCVAMIRDLVNAECDHRETVPSMCIKMASRIGRTVTGIRTADIRAEKDNWNAELVLEYFNAVADSYALMEKVRAFMPYRTPEYEDFCRIMGYSRSKASDVMMNATYVSARVLKGIKAAMPFDDGFISRYEAIVDGWKQN